MPRYHIGLDRLVIDATPSAYWSDFISTAYQPVRFALEGPSPLPRFITAKRLMSDVQAKRDEAPAEKYPYRCTIAFFDEDEVHLAALRLDPKFPRAPAMRLDIAGAAWGRGLAEPLARHILRRVADPEGLSIAEAHVAIDIDAKLDNFLLFRRSPMTSPRMRRVRSYAIANNLNASGYEWRQKNVEIVAYDKIAQIHRLPLEAMKPIGASASPGEVARNVRKAKRKSRIGLPRHATGWDHVMRVEVRLKLGGLKRPKTVGGVLDAARECFEGLGIADVRILNPLHPAASDVEHARYKGISAHTPTIDVMSKAREPFGAKYDEPLEWPDFGSSILRDLLKVANEETALESARLVHEYVFGVLHELDEVRPFDLVTMFDAARGELGDQLVRLLGR